MEDIDAIIREWESKQVAKPIHADDSPHEWSNSKTADGRELESQPKRIVSSGKRRPGIVRPRSDMPLVNPTDAKPKWGREFPFLAYQKLCEVFDTVSAPSRIVAEGYIATLPERVSPDIRDIETADSLSIRFPDKVVNGVKVLQTVRKEGDAVSDAIDVLSDHSPRIKGGKTGTILVYTEDKQNIRGKFLHTCMQLGVYVVSRDSNDNPIPCAENVDLGDRVFECKPCRQTSLRSPKCHNCHRLTDCTGTVMYVAWEVKGDLTALAWLTDNPTVAEWEFRTNARIPVKNQGSGPKKIRSKLVDPPVERILILDTDGTIRVRAVPKGKDNINIIRVEGIEGQRHELPFESPIFQSRYTVPLVPCSESGYVFARVQFEGKTEVRKVRRSKIERTVQSSDGHLYVKLRS